MMRRTDGPLFAIPGELCEEGVPGIGNIPRDTVTEIYLTSANPMKLVEVLVPSRKYVQTHAVHTKHIYYVDEEEGIRYTTQDDIVWAVTYFGSGADEKK